MIDQKTLKVGVVCDNYKLEYFKKQFTEAGFVFDVSPFGFTSTTIHLNPTIEQFLDLKRICHRCDLHFTRSN